MKNTVLCSTFRIAVVLQLGVLTASAQTNQYLYSGAKTNITLSPGTYQITAYGAQGGFGQNECIGGLGAEMSGEFSFSATTTLTLLVGGNGGGYSGFCGGGSYVVNGVTLSMAAHRWSSQAAAAAAAATASAAAAALA